MNGNIARFLKPHSTFHLEGEWSFINVHGLEGLQYLVCVSLFFAFLGSSLYTFLILHVFTL